MKRVIAVFLLSITVLIFTTALGLAVIHITNLPYVIDVDLLSISEGTGLSRDEIMSNYNAMMEYLSPFSNEEFSLPTLSYTDASSNHFADVKTIFNAVYLLGFASGIILIVLTVKKAVSRRTLQISGAITLVIPTVIGIALLTNFDRIFTFFHSLFFVASSWLFDPQIDEIIRILPSQFFMHCAILLAILWISGAALQLIIGYSKRKTPKT